MPSRRELFQLGWYSSPAVLFAAGYFAGGSDGRRLFEGLPGTVKRVVRPAARPQTPSQPAAPRPQAGPPSAPPAGGALARPGGS